MSQPGGRTDALYLMPVRVGSGHLVHLFFMPSEIYPKPRWFFNASTPLVRNEHIKRPLLVSKCSIGYFGCSSATNHTWTLFVFGWALCRVGKHEWHDRTDKERADEYLTKWSECEKELRGLRLLQMGDENPDPELRKLLRNGLGIDLDEGRIL